MRRSILLAGAIWAMAAPAHAASGGAGGGTAPVNPGIPQERRVNDDVRGSTLSPTREVPAGLQIEGTVVDGQGAPVGGVLVKLFSNGLLHEAARTESDGTFTLAANPSVGDNRTTVLWFQSPRPGDLLDVQALLSASAASRQMALFPECIQRLNVVGHGARIAVKLLTPAERQLEVSRSGCLGAG